MLEILEWVYEYIEPYYWLLDVIYKCFFLVMLLHYLYNNVPVESHYVIHILNGFGWIWVGFPIVMEVYKRMMV